VPRVDTLTSLRTELDQLKTATATRSVDAALIQVQEEITKPAAIFDPYVGIAKLEQLVDIAREQRDPKARRYNAVLKQCRPLIQAPQLQAILVKLVGNKEDVEVAKEIQKSIRAERLPAPQASDRAAPYPLRVRRSLGPVCYTCKQRGHIARFCRNARN